MEDITPRTWADNDPDLTDAIINTEIRNACTLMLNPPVCSVSRNTSTSVAAGTYMSTWTVINWTLLLIDTEAPTDPMWDSGSPSRITIRTDGWYECIASAEELTQLTSNLLTAAFRVNGSAIWAGSTVGRTPETLDISPANLIPLVTGDYIELIMTTDLGSAVTISGASSNPPYLSVVRRRGL